MKTSTTVWIIIIIIVVLGGWWWWSTSNAGAPAAPATEQTTPATSNTPPANTTPTVSLGTSSTSTIGTFLTADNGMTLYTFDKDSVGTTTCYGQCAQNWPPYTVPSGTQVTAPAGASGQTSTITRADGSMQVTYNGMPLYMYVKDTTAGDTTGDNVGKVWHIAKP